MYRDSIFNRLVKALEKGGDITLSYLLQKESAKQQLDEAKNYKIFRDELCNEISDEVINRIKITISASVDLSDIVEQIDDLKRALDNLNK